MTNEQLEALAALEMSSTPRDPVLVIRRELLLAYFKLWGVDNMRDLEFAMAQYEWTKELRRKREYEYFEQFLGDEPETSGDGGDEHAE